MAIHSGVGRLLVPLALGSALVAGAQPALLDRSNFRSEVRRVLRDHVAWTRHYLISATTEQPDKAAVEKRLLKNADDFAGLLKPFYSAAEAARLDSLFRDHVQLAGLIIESANQVDGGLREPLNKRWAVNADSLAELLGGGNRRYLPVADLKRELHTHLEHTNAELLARMQKDWDAGVAAHDKSVEHILKLADLLSAGLMRQYPRRFAVR